MIPRPGNTNTTLVLCSFGGIRRWGRTTGRHGSRSLTYRTYKRVCVGGLVCVWVGWGGERISRAPRQPYSTCIVVTGVRARINILQCTHCDAINTYTFTRLHIHTRTPMTTTQRDAINTHTIHIHDCICMLECQDGSHNKRQNQ